MRYTGMIATTLLLLALPLGLDAQVGVKSGASFGDVSNSGVLPGDVGRRAGFTIGVSAFTPGPLGLGLEGLYSQRGVSSQAGAQSRELEYLDLPILVRVQAPTSGVSPFVYAGPQVSYELACNAGNGDCPKGDRPSYPKAGIIGGGLAFGAETTVSVEARYIYGLDDLHLDTVTDAESYKERSFVVMAGIAF